MGVLDIIALVLFVFVFKTRPFEEDIDNENEERLIENLKT